MGLFGLLNYEDYILNTVVKSSFARNGLVIALIYLATAVVRFHLALILCCLFTWDNWLDLVFPVIVTVLLSLASDTLFGYVETHRPRCERIVDYFLSHYCKENFVRWKRYLLAGLCAYILFATVIVSIDNYFIVISTLQTAASFGICDILENKLPATWYNKLMDRWHRPRTLGSMKANPIIDNYQSQPIPKFRSLLRNRKIHRSLDGIIMNRSPTPPMVSNEIGLINILRPQPIRMIPTTYIQDIVLPKPPTPPMESNNQTENVPQLCHQDILLIEPILPKSVTPPIQ